MCIIVNALNIINYVYFKDINENFQLNFLGKTLRHYEVC